MAPNYSISPSQSTLRLYDRHQIKEVRVAPEEEDRAAQDVVDVVEAPTLIETVNDHPLAMMQKLEFLFDRLRSETLTEYSKNCSMLRRFHTLNISGLVLVTSHQLSDIFWYAIYFFLDHALLLTNSSYP
jgi:hypothetical protein